MCVSGYEAVSGSFNGLESVLLSGVMELVRCRVESLTPKVNIFYFLL